MDGLKNTHRLGDKGLHEEKNAQLLEHGTAIDG